MYKILMLKLFIKMILEPPRQLMLGGSAGYAPSFGFPNQPGNKM